MVYKYANLNILLLLHSSFMLCVVKMPLKGDVGGCTFNSHGNYIIDHGKSWKNLGIVFLNFGGNPAIKWFAKVISISYQVMAATDVRDAFVTPICTKGIFNPV